MKNRLLIALCKLFRLRKNPTKENPRILIVTTTALGDTLWAFPAIESLRKSFPKAYLAALTSPVGFEALRTVPWLSQIYLLPKSFGLSLYSLWKTLRKERFDTVLIFHASQRFAFPLSALLGATRVVSTEGFNKGLDSLCSDLLPASYEHAILRRLRMVEKVGGRIYTEKLSFFLDEKAPLFSKESFIILHPGAKDPFRRWPADHFAKLGKLLYEKTKLPILVTGSERELPLMESIAKEIPHAKCFDPTLPLHSFAKIVAQAKLVITNDTGPMHLACALQTAVVAIYAASDPVTYGAHKAKRALILTKPLPCTPCLKRGCRRSFCFLQFSPEFVLEKSLPLIILPPLPYTHCHEIFSPV